MKLRLFFLFAILFLFSVNVRTQQLYVGANYHPHDDKNIEKIKKDIQLMKEAGFKVVRMGHLAWDSYEPSEGKFDFAWFDKVMDMMNDAGIKVILDIAIRPLRSGCIISILPLILLMQMAICNIQIIVIWKMLVIRCIRNMRCDMLIHLQSIMENILH